MGTVPFGVLVQGLAPCGWARARGGARRSAPWARALVSPLVALLVAAVAACDPQDEGVPLDRPVFPTGMAIHPDPDVERLVVVSSNFNLEFDQGALLVVDLGAVRAALAEGDTVVTDAYLPSGSVTIPSFGDKPVFSGTGRLYVASRGENVVSSIDFDPGLGASCLGSATCGIPPLALQIPANDPFDVVITSANADTGVVSGLVTLLSSPTVFFFRDDPRQSGAQRMQLRGTLDLGEAVGGVRSAVLRPARGGSAQHVLAAVELARELGFVGAQIAVFEPSADANVVGFDVSAATGSLGIRDIILVPGEDGADDAVVAALRSPDALARFAIDDDAGAPRLRLVELAETCRLPTSLAYSPLVNRVIVTCPGGDTVASVDPITLEPLDAVRFFGREPYDVVLHPTEPEAYVSFFLDNSIGVLGLRDRDGKPQLEALGRIGEQLPAPEDGRE